MTLIQKFYVFVLLAVGAGGFLAGQHFAKANTGTSTQTTEQHDDKKTHTQTTTTTIKSTTGEIKTVTVTDKVQEEVKDKKKENITIVAAPRPTTSVSLLAATNTSDLTGKAQYGIYVSHEIIGNITAGAFGLTNGTIGLSIGLNF